MSSKVVPIDAPTEEEAAVKVQALVRGKNARVQSKYQPGKVEERFSANKSAAGVAFSTPAGTVHL